jgi:hypothetical protein
MPVSQLAKEGRRRGSPQSHRRPQPFENHNRPTFFIRKCGWGERLEDSFAEIILRTIPTRVGRTTIATQFPALDADRLRCHRELQTAVIRQRRDITTIPLPGN